MLTYTALKTGVKLKRLEGKQNLAIGRLNDEDSLTQNPPRTQPSQNTQHGSNT